MTPRNANAFLLVLTLGVLAIALLWLIRLHVYDNFGTVEPGRVFRSSQMSGADLDAAIRRYHIKSVLNLRGPNPDKDWYAHEIETSSRDGVAHYDVALSAKQLPPPEAVEELFGILDHAAYPMLIHCHSGADRTGLVSAVVLIDHDHDSVRRATGQLTVLYGHLPFWKYEKMDDFFKLYEQSGAQKPLRQWALEDYPLIYSKIGR